MHVHVNARRWFERTNGNTYHTVVLVVTDPDQDVNALTLGPSPITYGYGSHYEHTAGELLIDAGLLPEAENAYDFHSWRFREDHGITVTEDVADVPRRKDLHH